MQKQSRQDLGISFIPISERNRLHNQLDPSPQEYLEWLSINWAEYFAGERQQPSSSSSSWSPSSTCWSSFSWTPSWQTWHQHTWQDGKWSEKWWNEATSTRVLNEVDTSTRKLVSSASDDKSEVVTIHQKAWPQSWFFFTDFQQLRSRSCWFEAAFFLDFASGQWCPERVGRSSQNTSPDARTRTFFSLRVSHFTHAHSARLKLF